MARGAVAGSAAWLLVAVALLMAPRAAAGQESFSVEGRVVQGTAGAELPEALSVRLVVEVGGRSAGSWETSTDAEGGYRLEGVPYHEGAAHVLGVDHAGVSYTQRFEPTREAGGVVPDLVIYEAVSADPGLRLEQLAWILSATDEARQTLTVWEAHTVVNPGDRTFTPGAGGPAGPSGMLVFGLPTHAFGLTPHLGLDPSRIIQIDRGFASLNPVPPGRTEIVFSYQFPFSQSTYELRRTLRYPVESLRVLAPVAGPELRSPALGPLETARVGDREYQSLAGGPLGPGTVVEVTLGGLPARAAGPGGLPPAVVAGVGAAVGVLAVVGSWWWRRRESVPEAAIERR